MAPSAPAPTIEVTEGTYIVTWPDPDGTTIVLHDPHEDHRGEALAFTQLFSATGALLNEGMLRFLDSGDCQRFASRCASLNGTQPAQWSAKLLYITHHVREYRAQAPWPDPQPLPDNLRPVPTLPKGLLPEALRPWLVDIAERLQVPLEFPAVAAIVPSRPWGAIRFASGPRRGTTGPSRPTSGAPWWDGQAR